MSVRGDATRAAILAAGKGLFAEKGYSAVTMSNVCAKCGLSRGGLYRHFASTEEIFLAMLNDDKEEWLERMHSAFDSGIPAVEMLHFYLERMRAGILVGDGRISLAAYEYVRTSESARAFSDKRYRIAVDMFRELLEYGQRRAEFARFAAQPMAEHCVIFIDGLRIAASVLPLDPESIDIQLQQLASLAIKGAII